jgi:Nuclear cap-binding protein subunit 3
VPEKVHVRGLDNLSSADVKRFAADHFSLDQFVRIDWIDDTSANLTYSTPEAGADALAALTNTEVLNLAAIDIPLLQLRLGRKLSTHPNSELFVRQATTIDVKKKGASDASRYYLLHHPEKAFRERKGPRDGRRGRFRQDSDDSGDYNRTRFDDREQKRRRDERGAGFDANMYGDDAGETEDSG